LSLAQLFGKNSFVPNHECRNLRKGSIPTGYGWKQFRLKPGES